MSQRVLLTVLITFVLLTLAGPAAQAEERREPDRYAFSVGAGIVEPDGAGELYYTAALRIGLFRKDKKHDDVDDDDWRYSGRGDIEAYLEPEVGYWERDDNGVQQSDFSGGINAIGVVPGRAVDYFFGVGLGFHQLDADVVGSSRGLGLTADDTVLGGNFQVGLDIHLNDTVSLFGTGRFDVLENADDTLQGKVYMGLRFGF